MSVRLFHRGARLVIRWSQPSPDRAVWCAMHRRPVPWGQVFRPTLRLLGFATDEAVAGLRFGAGSLDWTGGPFWTTLRLQLPPCSARKAALLAAGLLKAARYAAESEGSSDPG